MNQVMRRWTVMLAAIVLAGACWGADLSRPHTADAQSQFRAQMFSDYAFRGRSVYFGPAPDGNSPDLSGRFDNAARSLTVFSGVVSVYEGYQWQGTCTTFAEGNYPDLRLFPIGAGTISSIKIGEPCPGADKPVVARLCQHVWYDGICLPVTGDIPDLARMAFNDSTSSLQVLQGPITVWEHANYRGKCQTFRTSALDLRTQPAGNDAISSLKLGDTCEAVLDLKVINGSSAAIACPAGYTKNPRDLNEGAGGDYIYLCEKRGPLTTGVSYVTDVDVVSVEKTDPGSWGMPDAQRCPAPKTFINVNLDQGATSSVRLYFCISTATAGSNPPVALRQIGFITYQNLFEAIIANQSRDCATLLGVPEKGGNVVDQSLNGDRGAIIFTCLDKS